MEAVGTDADPIDDDSNDGNSDGEHADADCTLEYDIASFEHAKAIEARIKKEEAACNKHGVRPPRTLSRDISTAPTPKWRFRFRMCCPANRHAPRINGRV